MIKVFFVFQTLLAEWVEPKVLLSYLLALLDTRESNLLSLNLTTATLTPGENVKAKNFKLDKSYILCILNFNVLIHRLD